ncbi:MAG TPA: DUF885 domain-containing protein [Terriglobales bacterium]|jgi:uncharacterized protein (DUF885 family)|nr:DUF885 domain-containing protein [Terriglobales bacterium]
MRFALIFVLFMLVQTAVAAPPAADLAARRKSLNDLLVEKWEYDLKTSPEFASILGDKRYNDQLSDVSLKAVLADLEMTRKFLARFEAIDTAGFPEQEALNKALMVRDLKQQLEFAPFKEWEMPVTQMSGPHLEAPQLVTLLAFTNVKDYEDYVSRLRKFPKMLDDTVENMRQGVADHLMPPRFLLEKVAPQADNIVNPDLEKSPFAQPLAKFPDSISEADRKRLRDETLAAIRESVNPAYVKFARFVREEYAPKGRTEAGIWSLPDGGARYAAMVKRSTTTDLTPEEIHQLGLKQVADLEAQMLAIAQKLGYKDVKTLNADIEKDPKLHAHSRQQILDLYRNYTDTMWKQLPTAFGRLPKAKLEVMPIEEFREKEAATHYNQGTPDGARPGHVMVNTGDFEYRKLISIESTAYHEGVPGHHMQISIAQELPELPPFRQHAFYGAYIEGWGLYSEKLGKEMGFYKDPYSDYGRLQDEMLRAIRLVVDTGFHYKHWTRQQVVDYFHAHSAIDEPDVQSETDRYMAWPAQALSYKIGQLKILELRERARKQLGDKFDLRAFHDHVLGAGALPLNVLEARMDAWVIAQNRGSGGTKVAK